MNSSGPPYATDCDSDSLAMARGQQSRTTGHLLRVAHWNTNIKPKKTPEPDGITNDMLRHIGPAAKKTLLVIYNKVNTLAKYLLDGKKLLLCLSSRKAKTRRRQTVTDLSACSAAWASYWKELSTADWCGSYKVKNYSPLLRQIQDSGDPIFTLKPERNSPPFQSDGEKIEMSDKPAFLADTLDPSLTWKPHLETVENRNIRGLSL
ncbi:hypothetical protein RRG08_049024 [Elysia crispata]|uniref:Uncharacterized protein n=1 Tax=Elysia crispata TaxID=231223 RepID=A0AAE0ZRP8_9GAST|nr:hypothetical protein RRG08_049024 [Elysia crispata]